MYKTTSLFISLSETMAATGFMVRTPPLPLWGEVG